MKTSTRKAYVEVLELLKYFPKEKYELIPKEKISVFQEFKDNNYSWKYNETKEFIEQDIMPETKALITILYEDYWATENQRIVLKNKEREAYQRIEDEKRILYNPDDIFKRNKTKNDAQVVEYKERKWYQKIFERFLNIFTK